jgi:LacI family transcriptional regulator
MSTLKEIAKQAGVSPGSVSAVMNGKAKERRIAPETCAHIEAVAARLGFQHNTLARSLKVGKSNLIGVVGHSYPAYHALRTREAARVFIEAGYQITMQDLAWRPQQEAQLLQELLGLKVEGLYLESGAGAPDQRDSAFNLLREQAKRGLPMVRLDMAKGLSLDVVTANREQGAYLAMDHLLKLGHRHITYMIDNKSDAPFLQARLRGTERALADYDLPDDCVSFVLPELKDSMDWRDEYAAGHRATAQVLTMRPRPTALLAAGDYLAMGAIAALGEAGLSVPDDIAVVGFVGYPETELSSVPLTTVAFPFEAMAQKAACMLIERIGGLRSEPRTITLPPQLVVRRSCGANEGYQTSVELMRDVEMLPERLQMDAPPTV